VREDLAGRCFELRLRDRVARRERGMAKPCVLELGLPPDDLVRGRLAELELALLGLDVLLRERDLLLAEHERELARSCFVREAHDIGRDRFALRVHVESRPRDRGAVRRVDSLDRVASERELEGDDRGDRVGVTVEIAVRGADARSRAGDPALDGEIEARQQIALGRIGHRARRAQLGHRSAELVARRECARQQIARVDGEGRRRGQRSGADRERARGDLEADDAAQIQRAQHDVALGRQDVDLLRRDLLLERCLLALRECTRLEAAFDRGELLLRRVEAGLANLELAPRECELPVRRDDIGHERAGVRRAPDQRRVAPVHRGADRCLLDRRTEPGEERLREAKREVGGPPARREATADRRQ